MMLPAANRRWIVANALGATAVVNVLTNAAPALLTLGGRPSVPLWAAPVAGGPSTITDTLGTLFLLPLITCLIVTRVIRRGLRRGELVSLRHARVLHPLLATIPSNRLVRALLFGGVSFAILSPPAAGILLAAAPDPLPASAFVAYKAILGVALGAFVTPLIALCAMLDG